MNRIYGVLVAMAVALLWYLWARGPQVQQARQDVQLAVGQARQGARFTAQDGRQVCAAIMVIDPSVRSLLPAVCFSADEGPK